MERSKFRFETYGIFALRLIAIVAVLTLLLRGNDQRTAAAPAAPAQTGPVPQIKIIAPDEVLIGEPFTFTVEFDNSLGTAVGFGPFVDIVLDHGGADLNTDGKKCDGLTFVSATFAGAGGSCDGTGCTCIESDTGDCPLGGTNSPPLTLYPGKDYTAATMAPCGTGAWNQYDHPYGNLAAIDTSGTSVPALGPLVTIPGAEVLTIGLPFGSFQPSQPKVSLQITALVSDYADAPPVGTYPLKIYARGGFRYGADPLNNALADKAIVTETDLGVTNWLVKEEVIPQLMTLKKVYLGPDHEAVTGPNFTSVYPMKYRVTTDLADGQLFNDLKVTDDLGFAAHYVGGSFDDISGTGSLVGEVPLGVSYPNKVTAPPDLSFEFGFYIPKFIGEGEFEPPLPPVLDPKTCAVKQIGNDISAIGKWKPNDPRDANTASGSGSGGVYNVKSDTLNPDKIIDAQCLAVQKSFEIDDAGPIGPSPGDLVRYELAFQVSDYFAFGGLKIIDELSHGMQYVAGDLTPLLTVSDRFGQKTIKITPKVTVGPNVSIDSCDLGGTLLEFDVSGALAKRASATDPGILTGGWVHSPTSTTPATGTIAFYASIRETFLFPKNLPGNPDVNFVDKHDAMKNCVSIQGERYDVAPTTPPSAPNVFQYKPSGVIAKDLSGVAFRIVKDSVTKEVYARNGQVGGWTLNGDGLPQFAAGDTITYRITKVIPTSDAEYLTVKDWLPLPVLPIVYQNNGSPKFSNTACGIPSASQSCLGPADDMSAFLASTSQLPPAFATDTTDNSVLWDYGSINDPNSGEHTIDLLFTFEVSDAPFADGLYLTNQVQECEYDSFGKRYCQTALVQFELTEPQLKITKGVVATDNPAGLFKPDIDPDIITYKKPTTPPGPCPRFSPTINSTNLPFAQINSDLENVDAGDLVTFAIVVENVGHGLNGAFDIELEDTLPPELVYQPGSVCVHDGAGVLIQSYLIVDEPPVDPTLLIEINNTLNALAPYDPISGKNILVITFDAKLKDDVKPGCYRNRAKLWGYAATDTGPNFVTAGFYPPFEDDAEVCVGPRPVKSITATSEVHTAPQVSTAGTPPLAIGEVVQYDVNVAVPEGLSPNFQIKDILPPEMIYMQGSGTFSIPAPISQSGGSSSISGGPTSCANWSGNPLVFDFKTLTNPVNTAPSPNYVTITFDALVCNTATNQDGQTKTNKAEVWVDGKLAASTVVDAKIVEPYLSLSKQAKGDLDIGNALIVPVEYTVLVKNNGSATAFDLAITDALPACLAIPTPLTPLSIKVARVPGGGSAGISTAGSTANLLNVTADKLAPGESIEIRYTVKILDKPGCPDCTKLVNTAKATWTSLPGSGTPAAPGNPPDPNAPNPTGSITPGASGTPNGERDGSGTGANDYTASATARLCGKMCGVKFHDLDEDGVKDAGEALLNGWTIQAKLPGPNTLVGSAVTGPPAFGNGTYCIETLPGSFTLGEVLQPGWVQTAPISPGTHTAFHGLGQDIYGKDFGNAWSKDCKTEVCGVKFLDLNGNGVKDPAETNIPGWPIQWYKFNPNNWASTLIGTTQTDSQGGYCITLDGPGTYTISEAPNSGYVQTAPLEPGNYTVDITCNPLKVTVTKPKPNPPGGSEVVAHNAADFGNIPVLTPLCENPLGVMAWGTNDSGEVGGPDVSPSTHLTPGAFVAVAAGRNHSLALDESGKIHAWGSTFNNVIGPAVSDTPKAGFFKAIAAGQYYSLAFDAAGKIHVWGDASAAPMTNVPGGVGFTAIAAGSDHALALGANNKIVAWGDNSKGQVSGPNSAAGPFKAIAAGDDFSLALDANSKIVAWGDNSEGQVSGPNSATGPFKAIAAGDDFSLALKTDGTIQAWGPAWIVGIPGGPGYQAIAGGHVHAVAIDGDGRLVSWGMDVDDVVSLTPTDGPYVAIAAGGGIDNHGHSLAIRCRIVEPPCVDPPPGMAAWWPLDEKLGENAKELIAGNNGQLYNGYNWSGGKVRGGLCLNGTTEYVEVPNAPALNFAAGQDMTIDAWVKLNAPADGAGVRTIVDKRSKGPNSVYRGYSFFMFNRRLGLQLADGVGGQSYDNYIVADSPSNLVPADAKWHLLSVAVRRAASSPNSPCTAGPCVTFYVDNSQYGPSFPTTRTGDLTNTSPLRIGRTTVDTAGPLKGCIDEVEIFKAELNQFQVMDIFFAGSGGKCKPGTPTPTRTPTKDATPFPPDNTPTPTKPPGTISATPTQTPSFTPTRTASPTPTGRTRTPSVTPTFTTTPTFTPSVTRTPSPTRTPTPTPSPTPSSGTLANIATRGFVGTVDKVLIGGFIIRGGPVKVIVRAIGRSMSQPPTNVPGTLQDPVLRLFSGQTEIAQNDNWQTGNCQAQAPAGLHPKDAQEACIVITLDPGPYTGIYSGAGGGTGIGLMEIFHAGGTGELVNIATRGDVQTGDKVMIGGLIIRDRPTKVIVRAIGPSMGQPPTNVPGTLLDPMLQLFSGQTVIAQNDNWQTGNCSTEAPVELRPKDPREACLVITLQPGPYTAIVSGVGATTGIGLVEVFRSGP